MRTSPRRWLHLIGGALGLLGVVFVLIRLNTYSEQIDVARFDAAAWTSLGLLALTYGAANVLLAQAWWHLLAFFHIVVEKRWAVRAYCVSQLAKYVPGNIFHLAGRQAIGMAAGLPATALAKSAIWELGLIAVAGAFFSFLAMPLVLPGMSVLVSAGAFGAICVGAIVGLRRLLSPMVAAALIRHTVFLAISAAVFLGSVALVAPSAITLSTVSALCGAYVIAWLAGLVTPGAPAGMGIRELVLLFLLKGVMGEVDLLLAVLLARIVTVLGDFSCFLAATCFRSVRSGYEPGYRQHD